MVVVIEKNANGKIEFTKEELEDLLEKAKQEGVKEGQKQSCINIPYISPSPLQTNNPYISSFTCQTPKTIATSGTEETKIKLNDTPITNGI